MPNLKNRMVFISHSRQYDDHYLKVVEWLDSAANFSWSNCSVPGTDALPDKTSARLDRGMIRHINPAQAVLILGGIYAARSSWMEYKILEAQRLAKTIMGIQPWGQERVPPIVQNASTCPMIGWNNTSVIQAVRNYT